MALIMTRVYNQGILKLLKNFWWQLQRRQKFWLKKLPMKMIDEDDFDDFDDFDDDIDIDDIDIDDIDIYKQ